MLKYQQQTIDVFPHLLQPLNYLLVKKLMDRFFRENNIHLKMEDEDETLLKEYTCDFVSFSYYSSSIATIQENGQQTAGNLVVSTKNPYLKASE